MTFKIISVDMNGFCGRDYHPKPEDVGRLVVPLAMEATVGDNSDMALEPHGAGMWHVPDETRTEVNNELTDLPHSSILRMWTCVADNGDILQLMDFEVELVRS